MRSILVRSGALETIGVNGKMYHQAYHNRSPGNNCGIPLIEVGGIEMTANWQVHGLLILEPFGVPLKMAQDLGIGVSRNGHNVQCQCSPRDTLAPPVGGSHEQDTVG